MASIRAENLHQRYGEVHALRGVDLEVHEGEFFGLLGPSGSGKTTLLRLLAGFEPADQGRISIGDRDVTMLPPEKREIGMVFQNYALFPHLTVGENIGYGLRAKRVPRVELQERVREMLALVDLAGYEDRDVHTLSGGQQQRVALARAIAPHPRVLLMDEPLSNLDSRLRIQTRAQIRGLQKRLGMTTVYVTHDQSEAFALSDRVAVLLDGELLQVGTPLELYRRPISRKIADFLGEINWVPGVVTEGCQGRLKAEALGIAFEVDLGGNISGPQVGRPVRVGIRPEALGPEGLYDQLLIGKLKEVQYEGEQWRIRVETRDVELLLSWPSPCVPHPPLLESEIAFSLDPSSFVILPADQS